MLEFQRIKDRYSVVFPIENINGIAIVAVVELDLKWLIEQAEKVELYEKALKAYGDEEGKNILKALDDAEEFIKRFNNSEIG